MAKLLYSATMSLDGFIAGPGGDMSWLTDLIGPNPEVDDLLHDIGALLVGNRTFRGDDPNRGTENEGAFSGAWDGPQVVVTHHPPADAVPGVDFVDDLVAAVERASTVAGDSYVNVLGANVAKQCLAAGLLDEILVLVAPLLLGDGVRLFEEPGGAHIRLERIRVLQAPLASGLWYRVLR